MPLLSALLAFLAGALACNGIPHLAAGLQGRAFPTPFAKPPGRGLSPPLVNALWGAANLIAAAALLLWRLPRLAPVPAFAAIALGFVLAAVFLSLHFGKVAASRALPET